MTDLSKYSKDDLAELQRRKREELEAINIEMDVREKRRGIAAKDLNPLRELYRRISDMEGEQFWVDITITLPIDVAMCVDHHDIQAHLDCYLDVTSSEEVTDLIKDEVIFKQCPEIKERFKELNRLGTRLRKGVIKLAEKYGISLRMVMTAVRS
jgi:hypothetical protein